MARLGGVGRFGCFGFAVVWAVVLNAPVEERKPLEQEPACVGDAHVIRTPVQHFTVRQIAIAECRPLLTESCTVLQHDAPDRRTRPHARALPTRIAAWHTAAVATSTLGENWRSSTGDLVQHGTSMSTCCSLVGHAATAQRLRARSAEIGEVFEHRKPLRAADVPSAPLLSTRRRAHESRRQATHCRTRALDGVGWGRMAC